MEYDEAKYLFDNPKTLLGPLKWTEKSKSGRKQPCLESKVRLQGSSVPKGAIFRISGHPMKLTSFTFQLEVLNSKTRSGSPHITLYRLDVCPLDAHRNYSGKNKTLLNKRFEIGETHEHDFRHNFSKGECLSPKSSLMADSVPETVCDYFTGINFACTRLNIQNGSSIPTPPGQGELI